MAINKYSPTPAVSPHLLDTENASLIIGFKPSTLKLSRVTGTLAGVEAPVFKKLGRKVVYEREVLEEWLDQFQPQQNTAQDHTNSPA